MGNFSSVSNFVIFHLIYLAIILNLNHLMFCFVFNRICSFIIKNDLLILFQIIRDILNISLFLMCKKLL